MIEKIRKLVVPLTIVCIVAALGLGFTYGVTRERISKQEKEKEAEACMEALPQVKTPRELKESKDLLNKAKKVISDSKVEIEKVFTSKKGIVFVLRSRGYGGMISLAIGISLIGEITGVSVISHNETPGLGANLENPKFRKQFIGKDKRSKLQLGKDIQALTGATFTSNGVVRGVKAALKIFDLIKGK